MNDNLRDNVKGVFDHIEDDFNPEFIWQGISDKMNHSEKKKKRYFVFWRWGLGFGLLILSASLILGNATATDKVEILVDELTSKSSQLKKEHQASTKVGILALNTADLTEVVAYNQETNSINKLTETHQSKEVDGYQISKVKGENALQEIVYERPRILKTNIVNVTKVTDVNVFESQKSLNLETYKQPLQANKGELPTETQIESEKDIAVLQALFEVDYLGTPSANRIFSNKKLNSSAKISEPILIFVDTVRKKKAFGAIEIYSGISQGAKVSTSSNSDYIANRNESEVLLEQLSFGLRTQVYKFSNITFWAGAYYGRITDSWNAQYRYDENLPLTYTDHTTQLLDGTIISHTTTETVAFDVVRNVVQFNSEQILSVPIEARCQTHYNRWNMAASLSFEFNYLLGAEHTVMGLNGLPVNELKFAQWIAPSISTRLSVGYAISPNVDINLGVNYRVLSISNSTVIPDLRSKYTLFGAQIGIGRYF